MKTGIPIKSERKGKKFKVKSPSGKILHFGNSLYEDFTQHRDEVRRKSYCARSSGIRNKQGKLTKNNKESANYYARKHLWFC
jgi:hypothetical protein